MYFREAGKHDKGREGVFVMAELDQHSIIVYHIILWNVWLGWPPRANSLSPYNADSPFFSAVDDFPTFTSPLRLDSGYAVSE